MWASLHFCFITPWNEIRPQLHLSLNQWFLFTSILYGAHNLRQSSCSTQNTSLLLLSGCVHILLKVKHSNNHIDIWMSYSSDLLKWQICNFFWVDPWASHTKSELVWWAPFVKRLSFLHCLVKNRFATLVWVYFWALRNRDFWFPGGSGRLLSARSVGDGVRSLGRKGPLEKEMATQSRILAWRIPWMEEPGKLHVVHRVTKRVGHNRAISLLLPFCSIGLFVYSCTKHTLSGLL